MNINPPQISFKYKFRNQDDFPASVTVVIGDFEIRGFAIRKSKFEGKEYAVFPPTVRSGGGWLKIFFTANKKLWIKLEKEIIDSFSSLQKENELNPDEIPF